MMQRRCMMDIRRLIHLMPFPPKETALKAVIKATMQRGREHGPSVRLRRVNLLRGKDGFIGTDGCESVFAQAARALQDTPEETWMLPARVWKVTFLGEGVDDCGGGYSESISEMCEELQTFALPLFCSTPNGRENVGYNKDCVIFNPAITSVRAFRAF